MVSKKYPKTKPITIAIQKFNIRKSFKAMIVKDYYGIGLKMLLKIQPTEYSKYYEVLLEYKSVLTKPQIFVCMDQLEIGDDKEEIPHNYGTKDINEKKYLSLCLYYKNEWNATMKISETIIPWICEWLYHFEFWSITGKWYGGGKHPTKRDIIENEKN